MQEESQKIQNLNYLIDHTALKHEDFNANTLLKLAKEALEYKFNSICIRPQWLKDFFTWSKSARQALPTISVVIGFPDKPMKLEKLGLEKCLLNFQSPIDQKLEEARIALNDLISAGQKIIELDPVLNIYPLVNLKESLVQEISAYLKLAKSYKQEYPELTIKLKPIFSSELLIKSAQSQGLEQDYYLKISVEALCQARSEIFDSSQKFQISYKNSTGFISGLDLQKGSWACGQADSLVARIAKYLNIYDPQYLIGIKASGGVKTLDEIIKILKDSDSRLTHIGTSSGVEITQKIF
jgi:deoxyribose-phosphate aldolase